LFTGIVVCKSKVCRVDPMGDDLRLHIEAGGLDGSRIPIGASIAVSGVCLTVTEKTAASFAADVSVETLRRTTLGGLAPGRHVNLEPSLGVQGLLGGHIVSGHVDAVGSLTRRWNDGRSVRMEFSLTPELSRYVVEKGSICVDGVSLTVNQTTAQSFAVNVIPHTLEVTTLGELQGGDAVNLEVDVIARHVEKLLAAYRAAEEA
jgi:riboflavin synthase